MQIRSTIFDLTPAEQIKMLGTKQVDRLYRTASWYVNLYLALFRRPWKYIMDVDTVMTTYPHPFRIVKLAPKRSRQRCPSHLFWNNFSKSTQSNKTSNSTKTSNSLMDDTRNSGPFSHWCWLPHSLIEGWKILVDWNRSKNQIWTIGYLVMDQCRH